MTVQSNTAWSSASLGAFTAAAVAPHPVSSSTTDDRTRVVGYVRVEAFVDIRPGTELQLLVAKSRIILRSFFIIYPHFLFACSETPGQFPLDASSRRTC